MCAPSPPLILKQRGTDSLPDLVTSLIWNPLILSHCPLLVAPLDPEIHSVAPKDILEKEDPRQEAAPPVYPER